MLDDVRRCAIALWPVLAGPKGVMYFGRGVPGITGGYAKDPAHLTRISKNLERAGYNVYVGINPSDAGTRIRASRSDIIEWRHVLIDIDPVSEDAEVELAMGAIAEELPQGVSSVIYSGRGMQAWVAIDPQPLTPSLRPRVERATAAYLRKLDPLVQPYGCRVDTSCSDLPRVARMPGTKNQKTGRRARLNFVSETSLPPNWVLMHEPPAEQSDPVRIEGRANLVKALPHLTDRACAYLIEGVGEPGRHSAAYAAAANLREIGVPEGLARSWMLRGAQRCSPPLGAEDALRALSNAYRKEDK